MPIRVMVVLAVMFMGAYMTVLKPKTEEVPPATAVPVTAGGAPQTQVGQPVSAAGNAVAGADARNAQAEAAASGVTSEAPAAGSAPVATTSQPAGSAAKAPGSKEAVEAGQVGGLPLSVLRGIADRKVLVLLFWNSKAADDRAVRRELRAIDRHKGKVLVHVAPLKKVAAYQQITRSANVDQSPTVVVVDGNRQVETLVGFNDRRTIDQAVSDAVRASRK